MNKTKLLHIFKNYVAVLKVLFNFYKVLQNFTLCGTKLYKKEGDLFLYIL